MPSGLFGISGTGRDILGTLGDAFLLQAGQKPLYAPRREQERIGEALQGFDQDPLSAIRRLGEAGYSDEAQKLYKNYLDNQNQTLKTKSDISLNEAKAKNEVDKAYEVFGSILGTASPESYGQVRELATKYATERGLAIPELPEVYDEGAISRMSRIGINPYQSQRLDQYSDEQEALADYRDRSRTETERHNRETEGIARQNSANLSGYRGQTLAQGQRRIEQADERIDIQRANSKRGRGAYPTVPPRQKGDRVKSRDGQIYVSHDGKRWVKER